MIHIAIDGDAGSGKTTVGRELAKKLGFEFIDSGLFYRLATYILIKKGIIEDKKSWLKALLANKIEYKNRKLYINGEIVEDELLRSKKVDEFVSEVSEPLEIREKITELLKNIALKNNVVMVGRDIGTVVLKDAFLKIFLTATVEERARRRLKELQEKGINSSIEEVMKNIKKRDFIDSTREFAPLSITKESYIIDTTNLTVEEVVSKVLILLEAKQYVIRNTSWNR